MELRCAHTHTHTHTPNTHPTVHILLWAPFDNADATKPVIHFLRMTESLPTDTLWETPTISLHTAHTPTSVNGSRERGPTAVTPEWTCVSEDQKLMIA